jgi:NADPH-dependent 2,4-dienoyl-CoA reductase/sulfur reductase-like enzyme
MAATLERIVVVGGSIAGVTAAAALRTAGWTGRLTLVSEESEAPYSRVPLSKGVLAGTQTPESAGLPALPDDVELRLDSRAVGLRPEAREVLLADGSRLAYDGLVIATGARARRLAAPGQQGELVVRTLRDAAAIAERLPGSSRAIVVGAGFLGMEVASTLRHHGVGVTVVDREPPLLRLLGPWLSDYLRRSAELSGVAFVSSPEGVVLEGEPVSGVRLGDGRSLSADIVISAAGDIPNIEWLSDSGLALATGVVVDERCLAAPAIVAAGDVAAREVAPGVFRRTPHWSNAVVQARAAASTLLDPAAPAYEADHYFWTEQFGLDVKIAGELPLPGEPEVVDGSLDDRRALLRWTEGGRTAAVVAINYRIPVARLKAMARAASLG